jgi:glyceraldehyde 3-phosphate dehydrogenase
LAPVAHVLNNLCGIENGFMTTIHAYTGDQNIHDGSHKDLHRARGAAMSMVPTSTGAASAIGKVIPALKGKLDGVAIRVPTANVSLVDLKFNAARTVTATDIQTAMQTAANGELKGVLAVYDEPLVSVDFNHSPFSANFALNEIKVNGNLVRVMAWYDNEWAFSIRMLDVAGAMKNAA